MKHAAHSSMFFQHLRHAPQRFANFQNAELLKSRWYMARGVGLRGDGHCVQGCRGRSSYVLWLYDTSLAFCCNSLCANGDADPDNSPPGPATAYDCGYGRSYTAGGNGSYANPLMFATAPGEFDKCEIIWDPYTKKYLIFQDTCAACIADWKKGIRHIDLWLGSTTRNWHKTIRKCERALTPDNSQPIVRDPAKALSADSPSSLHA